MQGQNQNLFGQQKTLDLELDRSRGGYDGRGGVEGVEEKTEDGEFTLRRLRGDNPKMAGYDKTIA